MPALSLFCGPTLQVMASVFPKVGTGSGLINCTLLAGAEPGHRFLSPKPFLKRAGLILLTEIDADLGGRLTWPLKLLPFFRRFRSWSCCVTPSARLRGQRGLPGHGKQVQSSRLKWICCILSPRRAPEARAQNRLGWLVGWLVG